MKDYLQSQIEGLRDPSQARNLVREYLQAQILSSLQRNGAMIPLAFHGGTALRFLYGTRRYSEDLDFALEGIPTSYNFGRYIKSIHADLEAQNYLVRLKVNDKKPVQSAFIRFPGLLYEFKLSPHQDEVLAVKIEVDTHPPAGANLATTIVRRHVILNLQHHDQASLLAGKLHAVLQRPYLKGRDIYDLLWYLSDPAWPVPNLKMLNNALQQTGWTGDSLKQNTWRGDIRDHLENADWDEVLADARPFVESPQELAMLNRDSLLELLG
jgi:predicted nucleotidyltransferase component of viral defense system